MDNGTVKKREMKAPSNGLNKRTSAWWPLIVFLGVPVLTIWVLFVGIKRFFISLFKQKKSVKGKLVLITGAGRGLGRSVAMELSKLGAHIACVDVNTKNNEETAELIRQKGGTAQAFSCNVAKVEQIERLKSEVKAKMGTVDILINNAALLMAMTLNDITYKDIRAIYEVNLMGPVYMAKAFLADMVERNSGHIVTISSMGAMASAPFLSLYCSTKSGVSRFFECARVELESRKDNRIKVTNVHPFFINTSADYTSWFQTFVPIMEENYVSRNIVEAIQYEKDSITVPGPLGIVKVIDALIGSYQYNCVFDVIGQQINLPTQKDRQELPYAAIVDDTVKTIS